MSNATTKPNHITVNTKPNGGMKNAIRWKSVLNALLNEAATRQSKNCIVHTRCPDTLSTADLKSFFANLISTHSWSTVKLDRNGLQFFYRHTLNYQTPPTTMTIRTKAIRTCPRCLHDMECVGITRPR